MNDYAVLFVQKFFLFVQCYKILFGVAPVKKQRGVFFDMVMYITKEIQQITIKIICKKI